MDSRTHSGFALVAALWTIVLMSLIASALAWSNRQSLQTVSSISGGIKARYLAEGGIQLVYTNLMGSRPSQRLLGDGQIIEQELPGGTVRLKLSDEDGKVDINGASASLLARLLYALDVETSLADALADAIVDYRDADELKHINGAEDADYEAAGLAWGAKDALFSSISELRKVIGMDEEIYQAMLPHVTIYTRQKGVNPMVASLPVLMAISDSSLLTLESYIKQRRRSALEGLPQPRAPSVDRRYISLSRGTTYQLSAVATTDRGSRSGLETTIRMRRMRARASIQTLDWKPYLDAALYDELVAEQEQENGGN